MAVWIDASALIALDAIGELDLLRRLLGTVFITQEVAAEVLTERASETLRGAVGDWVKVSSLRGDIERWRRLGLDAGEASLFLAPQEDVLILDDRAARRLAGAEGRLFTGLLGLLQGAARSGMLSQAEARALLDRLAHAGFRMSVPLYKTVREGLE